MKKVLLITLITLVSAGAIAGISYTFLNQGGQGSIPIIDEEDPKYQNTLMEKPASGTPSDYSPLENLYIAQGVYEAHPYKSTVTSGTVTASVLGVGYNQTVKNRKYVNLDESFSEALSLSALKKVGDQRYVTPRDYLVRSGSNVSESGASWKGVNVYSKEKYLELYGNLPFGMSNYILNDTSIVSAEVVEEGEFYTYHYILDASLAPMKFARETRTMASAGNVPTFSVSEITVSMDRNWNVQKLSGHDVYKIDIMGGLTCTSDLDNVFEFRDGAYDIPERVAFAPYFGAETDDTVDEVKEADDYLADAFGELMSGGETIHLNGSVALGEDSLSVRASMNLGKMELKFNLNDDLSVYYIGETASLYINYGKIFARVSQDELFGLIENYFPDLDLSGFSLDALLESEFVANIMENMNSSVTEDAVKIDIMSEGTEVHLLLGIEGDSASFKTVDFRLPTDDNYISGSFSFGGTPYKFKEIPTDVTDLTGLKENAVSMEEFIRAGEFVLDIDAVYKEVSISASGNLRLKEEEIAFDGEISLTYRDQIFDFKVLYIEDTFYVEIGEHIAFSLTASDLQDLLKRIEENFDVDLSTDTLLKKVPSLDSIDWTEVLHGISCSADGMSGSLNLRPFGLFGFLTLSYKVGKGIEVDLPAVMNLKLSGSNGHLYAIDPEISYVGYDVLSGYFDHIERVAETGLISIGEIDFGMTVNDMTIDITGNAVLSFKDGLKLEGQFEVLVANSIRIDANVSFIEDTLYLEIGAMRFRLSLEDLSALSDQLTRAFDLRIPSLSMPDLSSLNYAELLDHVSLDDAKLGFSFDTADFGTVNLSFSRDGTLSLTTSNKDIVRMECLDSYEFETPVYESALDYASLSYLIDLAEDAYDYRFHENFTFSFEGEADHLAIEGVLQMHIADQKTVDRFNINANIDETLTPASENTPAVIRKHQVDLTMIETDFYLNYNGNTKAHIDRLSAYQLLRYINDLTLKNDLISSLLQDLTEGADLDIFDRYQSGEKDPLYVNDMIQSLVSEEDKLLLSLNINGNPMRLNVLSSDGGFLSGTIESGAFALRIENTALEADIQDVNPEEYMEFSTLDDLVGTLIHTMALKKYQVNDAELSVKLAIGSLKLTELKVKLRMDAIIDEHNDPLIVAEVIVPSVTAVTVAETTSSIVFDGEKLHIQRTYTKKILWNSTTYTEKKVWTMEQLSLDYMEPVFFVANFSSSLVDIEKEIRKAMEGEKTDGNNNYTDFDSVLKNYAYDANEKRYDLVLNGTELAQDKNIGDISLSLYVKEDEDLFDRAKIALSVVDGMITMSLPLNLTLVGEAYAVSVPDWVNEN